MPKQEIANILSKVEVKGLSIEKYQRKPEKFVKLPAITFFQNGDNIKRQFRRINYFKGNLWFPDRCVGRKV